MGLNKPAIEHTRIAVQRDPVIVLHPALSGKCPLDIGNNPVKDPNATGTRITMLAIYGSSSRLIRYFFQESLK